MKKHAILILTSNYGSGHIQVARALKKSFLKTEEVTVSIRDVYEETSPLLNEWTKKIYLKSYTKSGRHLYRLFYYGSKEITKRKHMRLLTYGYAKLKRILEEEKPDVIINTFPSFAVPFYREKTRICIPTYNVLTDYCLHHSWVHPHIDKYFVATDKVKEELQRIGVSSENVVVSGIPVDESFEIGTKREMKATAQKNVLIVAGAYGVSKEMIEICDLLKEQPSLAISIVCGRNEKLFHQLKQKYGCFASIQVLGYVTDMAKWLYMADCIITKPGGIMLSEAVATNTPILIPKATPGQEKENAAYFAQAGAAIYNENAKLLASKTMAILTKNERYAEIKSALAKLYVPHSAKAITNTILQELNQFQTNRLENAR